MPDEHEHRIRLLRTPLSNYDRYACEWVTAITSVRC